MTFLAEMPGASPTIEEELKFLPDSVADALGKWRLKTAEKKREYEICLDEIIKESHYVRLYERLMCAKRSAQMRTAF